MLEYIVGNESHTSNWGKFYVKGIEKYEVKEEHNNNRRDGHHSYQFYMADVPVDTCFTIFEQNGDKRGTDVMKFKICVVSGNNSELKAEYGDGFCNGNYDVIAEASGKIKSPRLMTWWDNRPKSGDLLAYARHCAAHIDRRGIAVLPPMTEKAA